MAAEQGQYQAEYRHLPVQQRSSVTLEQARPRSGPGALLSWLPLRPAASHAPATGTVLPARPPAGHQSATSLQLCMRVCRGAGGVSCPLTGLGLGLGFKIVRCHLLV